MEIISKKEGLGRDESTIKRVLQENRGTINRLADHLTQGAWSSMRARPPQPPQEAPSRSFGYVPTSDEREIIPHVRISPNDRVILMDAATSRQIAFLGVITGRRQERRFVLATKANGFSAVLDDDQASLLGGLDGFQISRPDDEDVLVDRISEAFKITPSTPTVEGGA